MTGNIIDLTSDDFIQGLVDRKCHSGSLSDHEHVRGCLAWRGERASC